MSPADTLLLNRAVSYTNLYPYMDLQKSLSAQGLINLSSQPFGCFFIAFGLILHFFRNILKFLEKYLIISLYTKSINKVIKGETSCKMF